MLRKDPFIDEFLKVYLVLADLFMARQSDDYDMVTALSGDLFGSADRLDPNAAEAEYGDIRATGANGNAVFTDRQMGDRFEKEFAVRGWKNWNIEYRNAVGGNISIYETEKKVIIRTGASDTRLGLESVICHELDGHAPQAFNALENPDYGKWLLAYLGTEQQYEGYATFVEFNNLTIAHINSEAEKRLLLMLAAATARQASFFDTYQTVLDLCNDRDFAFMAALKSKRGFRDTSRRGCFQKENSYLLGALDIIDRVGESKDNYHRLCQGCFPLSALSLIPVGAPRFSGVREFNRDNWDYFRALMGRVLV